MKQFKKTILSAFILATAMFHSSYAQCSGKTVYIQLPEQGWDKVFVYDIGRFLPTTLTKQGLWSVFTMPNLELDNYSGGYFSLSNKNGYDNTSWIGGTSGFNNTGGSPMSNQSIQCSSFGSGDVIYISEDPTSPGKTIISTEPPNAKYFYLLPPHTRDWIEGIPYIMDANGNKTPMQLDQSNCGWYKVVYFEEEPPTRMMIGIGPAMQQPINRGIFDLAEKFKQLGNEIYFHADAENWLTSRAAIEEESDRCSYLMSTTIYDTDRSVNQSFSLSDEDIGAGYDQYSFWSSGIIKGMVTQTLPASGKLTCANCAKGGILASSQGYFVSEADFYNAFDPASNTNVAVCYDMPFQRSSSGLWEFDSDKMLNHQGKVVGGFYPEILQNRVLATNVGANYGNCPDCDTKYKAESFVNLTDSINPWCFERGLRTRNRTGQSIGSCGAAYGPGDFAHGGEPADTWGATPTGSASWLDTWREANINLWDGSNSGANAKANSFFCFESHATFKYDPAHEFFFRGDDDIWVYINKKLVVDLGGTKLAAPGYVKLDTLGLTEGQTYPIDIFFCDRRTTMSNIRIASNIYFGQISEEGGYAGLFLQETVNGNEICLRGTTANSCAASIGTNTEPICGAELAPRISYYLNDRAGNKFLLDGTNSNCTFVNATQGVCYGGILLNNGIVSVSESAITDETIKQGFILYASVSGYSSKRVFQSASLPTIAKIPAILKYQEPMYYNIKGEPLGKQKPKKAGVYIVRQGGVSRIFSIIP